MQNGHILMDMAVFRGFKRRNQRFVLVVWALRTGF